MSLPLILTGPILRRVTPTEVVVFLCTSRSVKLSLALYLAGDEEPLAERSPCPNRCQSLRIGEQAFVHLLQWRAAHPLPQNRVIEYDLLLQQGDRKAALGELLPDLCYDGARRPSFILQARLEHLLHGSCRKPHYPGADALLRVDELIAGTHGAAEERPALLMQRYGTTIENLIQ